MPTKSCNVPSVATIAGNRHAAIRTPFKIPHKVPTDNATTAATTMKLRWRTTTHNEYRQDSAEIRHAHYAEIDTTVRMVGCIANARMANSGN